MKNTNETSSDLLKPNTTSTTPTSESRLEQKPAVTPQDAVRPVRVKTLQKTQALARLSVLQDEVQKLPAKAQKQRINQLKNELELTLRELAAPAVGAVLGKALDLALAGDRQMIRLILELHLSKPQAYEDVTGGRNAVNIQINNLTKPKQVEVIDVSNESASAGDHGDSEEHAKDDAAGS